MGILRQNLYEIEFNVEKLQQQKIHKVNKGNQKHCLELDLLNFSRPRQSQGLLHKHCGHQFIK